MRPVRVRLGLAFVVALAAGGFLPPDAARAAEWWFVATTGNDANDCLTPDSPCASIEGAIHKAASGDVILVGTGIYTGTGSEVVLIDRDLILFGGWNVTFTSQTGFTTVDGEANRQGVVLGFESPTVSLDRFVVRKATTGLSIRGTLTMTQCAVKDNEFRGIENLGTLTLNRSAVENSRGGGGIWNDGTLEVNASTISGNTSCCGGDGGGIHNFFIHSTAIINNSTVSGNHTTSEGGGIYLGGGFVSLNNSTVTGNSAEFGGGGISNRSDGTVELQNTILAGNTGNWGPDCWGEGRSTYESKGFNLIGSSKDCDELMPGPADLFNVVPALGPLLDNGGPTRTHRPESNSPVINAGNWSGCTDADGMLLVADQRGVARPQGTRCEIGAVERMAFEADSLALDLEGNSVLEPGEVASMVPAWQSMSGASSALTGSLSEFRGPGEPDTSHAIVDGTADYGTVATGATTSCAAATGDCYGLLVSVPTFRPATHWDATIRESLSSGVIKDWTIHIGDSFDDVPRTDPFYRFIETLLHHSVTAGCSATGYCPTLSTTRAQMAVFVLRAKEGGGYSPPACGSSPAFADVPASDPFCPWVEELARRGVVSGCGGGNYCPDASVTRAQMAVFVLKTLDPSMAPPVGTTPIFDDVPLSDPFCRWIEELARRGVVVGCGGGNYCPTSAVNREQMGVFIGKGFELSLYGP